VVSFMWLKIFQVGGLGLKVVGDKHGSFGKGSDPLFGVVKKLVWRTR
jgi:hypothetical protein